MTLHESKANIHGLVKAIHGYGSEIRTGVYSIRNTLSQLLNLTSATFLHPFRLDYPFLVMNHFSVAIPDIQGKRPPAEISGGRSATLSLGGEVGRTRGSKTPLYPESITDFKGSAFPRNFQEQVCQTIHNLTSSPAHREKTSQQNWHAEMPNWYVWLCIYISITILKVCFCLLIFTNFTMALKQEMIGMLHIPGFDFEIRRQIFPWK